MAILNQKRILNLIPKVSAPVTIHVSQGDVGTQIEFTLVKGDEVFSDTGNLSASVHGVREDSANFGPFICTLSGSKVTFPLHSEMTAVKGSAVAEIVLVDDGGNKVGSANFGILVEESVFPLGVTYDNDVSVYESILAYVQAIPSQITADYNAKIKTEKNARQTADDSINETLSSEISARAVADTTINARIDELIAPSGEAPSAAEVTDARIGADSVTYPSLGTAIRTQLQNVVNDIGITTKNGVISWYDKYYYNTNSSIDINTRSSYAIFRCACVACTEGDKFTISCKSTSGAARIYAFIKSDGTIIEKGGVSQGNTGVTDFQLTAPAQSAYLILNDMAKNRDSFKNRLLYRKVDDIENTLNSLLPIPYREIEDSVVAISDIDDLPSTTILNVGGQHLPIFESSSNNVHIDIELSATVRESANCRIMYYDGENYRNASNVSPLEEGSNTKNFVIDCASLIQYQGAEHFAFFFSGNLDVTITSYTVAEHSQLESYTYYNKYFETMMANVFSKLDSIANAASNLALCSPNGNKKGLILTGENTIDLFKYIPDKMLIMGNSIVFGFSHGGESFGMAATRGEYDFANRVIELVKTYNADVVANKLYTSPFEHCTTLADAQQFITNNQSSWSSDLDLVIIQIGDNVNTTEKRETFADSFPLLIKTIRNASPKARILIVGIWFNNATVYDILTNTANKYGCTLVDIRNLRSSETEGELGATVYFKDGTTTTVTDARVTHPGNLGMEYIADAIENVLDL